MQKFVGAKVLGDVFPDTSLLSAVFVFNISQKWRNWKEEYSLEQLAPVLHERQVFGLVGRSKLGSPAATFQWAAQAPLINTSPHVLQILCATSNPQVSPKIYNPFQYLEATEVFGEGRNTDFGCFYTTVLQTFNYLTPG